MTNIGFLTTINGGIFKSNENKYYVRIPFISYNIDESYLYNFNNSIFILLTDDLLANDDLEEFITVMDDRYEYTDEVLEYVNSSKKYQYYANLNRIVNIEIDEEDIKNTNVTFMNILKQTETYNNLEATDYLYKYVIDFYSNGQYDDALILMNSIFNNQINISSTTTNCGCNQQASNCSTVTTNSNSINTGTDLINYDDATCIDKYKAAMYQWLQKMLSDTEFYCHWLFIDSDDEEDDLPNDVVLDKLIELLQFLLDNYDLSNLGKSNTGSYCNHKSSIKCNESFIDNYLNGDDSDSNNACSNYSIIKNYIEVLNYVKEDKVLENKNKIYVYGKKFAEIFPLLNFN